jgi:type IV pilus assembly protein PilE
MKPNRQHQRGFTLIELLIVVVIVGILAAIAIPSFLDSVRKSRRADGKTALMALSLAQEKHRANCTSYATSITGDTDAMNNCTNSQLDLSTTSADGYYTIAFSGTPDSTGFTATANPNSKGGQSNDTACLAANFQINQNGPDKSTAAKASCWGQ